MENYLFLKIIHLLGVVVFLGNIIVTGWWKFMADRTGNHRIIAFAQRQVTLTDFVFTAGGVVLVAIGGIGNAMLHHMDYLHIKWMAWGYWQFIASGVIWVVVLIPVQIAQAKMARTFENGKSIPPEYWKLGKIWYVFGTLATLLPASNIYWMVFKPI
ncbi:DUF2269 family protein [Ferrovum myxofaciens]|uniref:DUF2269 domain-containing protein n=1 Tax=Ferrovum myxofaciens TaxID=416213 RepID=A0A9E6SXY8_9PROT|nr:DUF2269 family protein [Ferrovum myxofaciens]QKE39359.1 MAG: DUF2269 domain-containing protein [Ferrovum myxofaciens]QWY74627.1 MAG: DUF2269 domain-containing protein [Ferrovum myxofaciens]QWY77376.1 MAG: DUF2269 domain-containing protein [Ferrovum myxofaciens]